MSASFVTHRIDLAALEVLDAAAWREQVLSRLGDGMRLVTLFGRPGTAPGQSSQGEVVATAVLAQGTALHVSRGTLSVARGFHEMTTAHPAMHCFERELHEQTGVRIAGHPWLKPIRFERGAMDDYAYHVIEGKEVHEVGVGPIHAGVIEPGAFRFTCLGEQVHHLEIQLGYQHRGVEGRLLQGDPLRLAPVVETIAGDTSVAHTWAYCAAVESLCEVELERGVELERAIVLEIERVAMHLATLSGLAADIGFLQGATSYGRLRTTAINAMMRLCGSRFGRGALRPGGLGMAPSLELKGELGAALAKVRHDLAIIDECFLGAQTVQHRLRGVGVLSGERARELGVVGVCARASGQASDLRAMAGDGVYAERPVAEALLPEGDCLARAQVRILEMHTSLAWLSAALDEHAEGPLPKIAVGRLPARHLAIALVEGFRGEVVHSLETGDAGQLVHYKVQDPSLRNWMGLAIAMRQNEISDFPICNKSFDLSYCGSDL